MTKMPALVGQADFEVKGCYETIELLVMGSPPANQAQAVGVLPCSLHPCS